jgi:hypothetical protein
MCESHDGGLTVDALMDRMDNEELDISLFNFILIMLSHIQHYLYSSMQFTITPF